MTLRLTFHGAVPLRHRLVLPARDRPRPAPRRLRHVPGPEDREGAQLPPLPVRPDATSTRSSSPTPISTTPASCRSSPGTAMPGRSTPRRATVDLACVMLPDSGLHPGERGRAAQPAQRPAEPAAGRADLHAWPMPTRSRAVPRGRLCDWFEPLPGVRARFWNAGHLLGSASIEVEARGRRRAPVRILFSADIGPDVQAPPSRPDRAERPRLHPLRRRPMATATASTPPPRTGAIVLRDEVARRDQSEAAPCSSRPSRSSARRS